MLDRVLVVCVGNICRSPMAEALLRDRIGAVRPAFQVSSAGLGALVGHPADPVVVELMAARGLDVTGHRARQVTDELLAASDLVLVMELGHMDELHRRSPRSRGKVHRIGRFGNFDVPDPYRRERAAFEDALALIERGIADFQKAIWPVAAPRGRG